MQVIHYHENPVRGRFRGRSVPYDEQDACAHWAEHYRWQLVLTQVVRDQSRPTVDRRRAEVELRICERKLAHWERHRNWDAQTAARLASDIKRQARAGR